VLLFPVHADGGHLLHYLLDQVTSGGALCSGIESFCIGVSVCELLPFQDHLLSYLPCTSILDVLSAKCPHRGLSQEWLPPPTPQVLQRLIPHGGGLCCLLRAPSRVLYFVPCNQCSSFVSASLLPLAPGVCFQAGALYPGCSEHSYCCMFTVSTLSVASFVPSVQQWQLRCTMIPSSIVGLSGMRVAGRLGTPVWSKHSYLCSSIGQVS
jgi:hypothetical protein